MKVYICQADAPNSNGRIYSKHLLEKIISNAKTPLFGEFGMNFSCGLQIENISHVIENLHIENEQLVGDLNVLKTPKGKILQSLIEGDIDVSNNFRLAGIGSIKKDENNNLVVQDDYKLISINYTNDPA